MTHIKWLVSSLGSLVLVVIAGASFLGISSVNDIGEELSRNVKSLVTQAIEEQEGKKIQIKELHDELQSAKHTYDQNKDAIKSLSILATLKDVGKRDPQFAYESLKDISQEKATPANRGTALKLLEDVIEAGQRGLADPNLLFNTATIASRLNLQLEALKLAVLAEHWQASVSHRAIRAETAQVLGRNFEYRNGRLHEMAATPYQIKEEAWKNLLELVGQVPREESEQVYGKAWNVALRNRSSGYFKSFIEKIKETEKSSPTKLTSYAYAMLAKLIAHQGSTGWKREHEETVAKALELLKTESPLATWYDNTREELDSQARFIVLSAELEK